MKVQKYEVLENRTIKGIVYAVPGDYVYDCMSHDYGCASDDTRHYGVEHTSVTCKSDGSYPFFTIPVSYLKKVD